MQVDRFVVVSPLVLQSIGAAEVDTGDWEGLETRYAALPAVERVHLACGVLSSLGEGD